MERNPTSTILDRLPRAPPPAPRAVIPMKTTLLLAGLLLLAPIAAADAETEPAACTGPPCDQINLVCQIVFGQMCLGLAAETAATDCTGTPCDEINYVCEQVFGAMCLGFASPSPAGTECTGYWLCDTLNDICGGCIPAARTEGVACEGPVCDAVNEACRVAPVLPEGCVA